jgi:tRNA threonylcarbamoyladenosine biosynthesis protein TsaB
MPDSTLLLAIDTCGPTGSVALGSVDGQSVEILGQIELEGRSYSSTLVAAVSELLVQAEIKLSQLHAMVAVNGPGSFTGVRVGLAAVKGLAEAARIPVVAVSRLEVLAAKAGAPTDRSSSVGSEARGTAAGALEGRKAGLLAAALDAHRHEIFLRLVLPANLAAGSESAVEHARELLAGVQELALIEPPPSRIALCDEAAAELVSAAWPEAELIRTSAPTAADALLLCAPRVAAGEFVDLALLDGHYLRRSDAEIFGAEIFGTGIAAKPAAAAPEGR